MLMVLSTCVLVLFDGCMIVHLLISHDSLHVVLILLVEAFMVCFTETFNLSHKKERKKNLLLWAYIALAHDLLTLPKIYLWD